MWPLERDLRCPTLIPHIIYYFPRHYYIMANAQQVEIKGGYSLAMVPFLDGADNWLDFSDGIQTFLIMGNQLDWLEDHRNTPVNPSAEWKKKHKFAIYAMRARSNYNAKQMTDGISNYYTAYEILEKNYKPQGDGTFRDLSDRFFTISLADHKNIEDYTEAVKKLQNQLIQLRVTIPEPLVILRYLQGLGSAYSIFYTSFTTNNQILPGDDGGEVDFDFVALKAKGYERTLAQEESVTMSTALTTVTTTDTALAATGDTRNIEVPYCTHCHKSYHTKENCWTLHPHLKQQAKAGKGRRGPSSKKRKTREDDDESDDPIGLIAHFGMTANNDTGNLLHTQWAVDTGCSRHITHSREQFISYEAIPESSAHIKGLGGTSYAPIGRGTVKLRCNIKGKSRSIHLTNVYHVPDCAVNLISVAQLFNAGADIQFSKERCKITTRKRTITATGRNGCWFLDTTLE
jgi:hypothetical protein